MHPPIRYCIFGHSYCNDCFKRLRYCPQCRGPHNPGLNLLMEDFHSYVAFPCKFKEEGCQSSVVGSLIAIHERNCIVNWKHCPFINNDYCTWIGPVSGALEHCSDVHRESLYVGQVVVVTWKDFGDMGKDNDKMNFLTYTNGNIFSCIFEADKRNNRVYWSVRLVGEPEQSLQYRFEIELTHPGLATTLMFAPCGSVVDGNDVIRSSITMFYRRTKRYCVENDLQCKLRIRRIPSLPIV